MRLQSGSTVWILILFLALALVAVCATGFLYLSKAIEMPLHPGEEIYTIEKGHSLKRFARELKQRGVINETYSLLAYAYWKGHTTRIKAGQYRFADAISLKDLLQQIVEGDVVRYQVQFIEGWTFAQLRQVLDNHQQLEHVTSGKTNPELMSLIGYPDEHPEGQFFPDTYQFQAGSSDLEILQRAFSTMQKVVAEEWQGRQPDIPLDVAYEALILASIVEKETGKPEERGKISGVFINRLNKKMRLQTDPTVIYGLGERFNGNIRRKHLKEDNPYNTYTRGGLPPTPIAMPGRDAIHAAVQPEKTSALYFVSKGDGSHYFSETIQEHNKAVRKYQLRRKSGG